MSPSQSVEDCLKLIRVEWELVAHPLHVPLGDEALLLLVADGEQVAGLLGEQRFQLTHGLFRDAILEGLLHF